MKIRTRSITPFFQIAIFFVSIGLLNACNSPNLKLQPSNRSTAEKTIIAAQPNLNLNQLDRFPTRKIASKQAIGKLSSLLWGDYFYATIKTKTENITLIIDGMEDCLLKQNKNKIMTIEYDEIERYTPQLNGYRNINIIKQIDRVDVDRWQRSLSRSAIKQCQPGKQLGVTDR
jgi:hypothetical protein